MSRFKKETTLAAPASFVFDWHERPGAFERLKPPWEAVRVVERSGGIRDGDRLIMEMGVPPMAFRWVAEHRDYRAGESFCDVQIKGPFARWEHIHRVEAKSPETCTLIDDIEYQLPLGAIAEAVVGRYSRSKLERMFRYRHTVTAQDVTAHWANKGAKSMKILISGSSGLIGGTLVPFLTTGDHQIVRLVRSDDQAGIRWNPKTHEIDAARLEGFDAVVHLAGDNISEGRWTDAKKKRIRDSRVDGTRLIAESLAALKKPPKVLVCASAIGYYGDRGAEPITEEAVAGDDFLSDVCVEWEQAADPARDAGIRVVHLRFGVILAADGGALAKMLPPFKMGLGGVIGSGEQYMSWVTIDDAVGMVLHALTTDDVEGPVNAVAPTPVTNLEYTKTLGEVLSRPTLIPLPAFAARLVFGEMADALLLSSTRVVPTVLEKTGYRFRFSELEPALRHLLGA